MTTSKSHAKSTHTAKAGAKPVVAKTAIVAAKPAKPVAKTAAKTKAGC